MPSFEIDYPVVGSVKLASKTDPTKSLILADTYFEPLMEGVLSVFSSRSGPHAPAPSVLRMWQEQTQAFDVEGGEFAFDPEDGLLPLLESAGPRLPGLDTSLLKTPDGAAAPSLDDARLALASFLAAAIEAHILVTIEDIP